MNASLVICAVIFALVTGLILYCMFRFRARAGAPDPLQLAGHKRLELLWTVIPFLTLVYLFVLTAKAMNASDPPKPGQKPDLVIVAHQFWWEARYPSGGFATANEIHIPTGRRLRLRLLSADVIHTFWVPQLARKMDMLPDQPNDIWIEADTPGRYLGTCSEFCGLQHAWMRLAVVAESPEQFQAWQHDQAESIAAAAPGQAANGAAVFRELTCVNCHTIRGLQATQNAAPDLTHLASRLTLGAGVISNTPENLASWITDPQAIKPGNLMPRMQMTKGQLADLTAFLETLR